MFKFSFKFSKIFKKKKLGIFPSSAICMIFTMSLCIFKFIFLWTKNFNTNVSIQWQFLINESSINFLFSTQVSVVMPILVSLMTHSSYESCKWVMMWLKKVQKFWMFYNKFYLDMFVFKQFYLSKWIIVYLLIII